MSLFFSEKQTGVVTHGHNFVSFVCLPSVYHEHLPSYNSSGYFAQHVIAFISHVLFHLPVIGIF